MEIEFCYNEAAKRIEKIRLGRLIREAAKLLPPEYKVSSSYNPGGIAVWGEHWVKIHRDGAPVVECIIQRGSTLVRQWDGRNSGRNTYVQANALAIAQQTRALAAQPFQRF